MNPRRFRKNLQEITDPNQLDEIKEDLEHLVEQSDKAQARRISFGFYSHELDGPVHELVEAQANYRTTMQRKHERLERMLQITKQRMDQVTELEP